MSKPVNRQGGFSLVELMVAMAITLIISGAIYGLLSGGQTAFRREPELTDRQQNIRLAMALIERDIYGAGAKMPLTTQVFTDGLDGISALPGLNGNNDFLEIRGSDEECPDIPVVGRTGDDADVMTRFPDCYPTTPARTLLLATFAGGGISKWGVGTITHGPPDKATFGSPQPPGSQISNGLDLAPLPSRLGLLNIVRYEIATTDGAPCLYRSAQGGINLGTGVVVPAPGANAGWQMVARGIEDLQVRYEISVRYPTGLPPTSVWQDNPGAVGADPDSLVRRVEVMLSARVMAPNLQGQTSNANLGPAVRGQLTTRVSPRATLLGLQDPVKIGQGKGWY